MFVVGECWLNADAVWSGDAIRNADLQSLRVVSANLDGPPQLVHNLEVADAHTYFVGDLEALNLSI
ncbi:MAG: HINT domain-containing protein [Pelagimonas sp.]|nr:HINT domain-containing protein [Pelagimonas sp.]